MTPIYFSASFPLKVKDQVLALLNTKPKPKCKKYNTRSCDISGYTSTTNLGKILIYYMYSTSSYAIANNPNITTKEEKEELHIIYKLKTIIQSNDTPQYIYPFYMSEINKQQNIQELTKIKNYLNTIIAPLYEKNSYFIKDINDNIQNRLNYISTRPAPPANFAPSAPSAD